MDYIFYHGSDFDGMCSGKIIERWCMNPKVYAHEYQWDFPEDFHPTMEDTVYFADVTSNPYERIFELTKQTNVIVLDHHNSFIKWAKKNVPQEILSKWVLDKNRAACMICWDYTHPHEPYPLAVDLFGNYDIWNNADKDKWNFKIMPWQYGARGIKFDDEVWSLFLTNDSRDGFELVYKNIMSRGSIIWEYVKAANASVAKKHCFEVNFEGLRALACNTHNFSSQTFDALWDETKYDLMIAFEWSKGKEYWISLYTTKKELDLSVIAVKYGGGGHEQACGFRAMQIENIDGEFKVRQ